MTDESPSQSLADRALQRLRKLATGNGLEPAAITLAEVQEQVFTLNGLMEVSPLCETQATSYPGGIKGKDRKPVATAAALQQAVEAHKQAFQKNADWVKDVAAEIKAHDQQGWGLENAKVTLPQFSAIFASPGVCPSCDGRQMQTCAQCNGQGMVICTQCQGQGRELCYHCGGRGENPQAPGQPCTTCNGTRYAPCRFCQTRGHLPCPTCQGKRGTPCSACAGSGRITQEIAVTCGAETHFKLQTGDLPSGLRRGLDRVGIANLGKGHADIVASEPVKQNEGGEAGENKTRQPQSSILIYKAELPYAEMRMGFGGKKAVVSAFGKRCMLMGVPNFLDDTLKPWREKLHQAAQGTATLDEAMQGRALREILALTMSGKGRAEEVRKVYPFGLSTEAIASILADLQLALNHVTLKTRAMIAALCAGICAAFFYFMFMTDSHAQLTHGMANPIVLGLDSAILAAALGISWATLSFSTRLVLQKRFPQHAVALQQKIGKTGFVMLGAIIAAFAIILLFAPMKPLWLTIFMR